MPTTPINGARYPAASDSPNGPLQIQNLALDYDTRVLPRFANETARNNAITSPQEGMHCILQAVSGSPSMPQREQTYRGGQWRDVSFSPAIVANLLNTGGSTITNGVWTVVPFNTEEIDSVDGHSNTTNNSRWFVPITGYYTLAATVAFASSSNTNSQRGVRLRRNGDGGHYRSGTMLANYGANSLVQLNVSVSSVYATAGDFFDVQAFQNTGADITTFADANLASTLSITAVPGGQ